MPWPWGWLGQVPAACGGDSTLRHLACVPRHSPSLCYELYCQDATKVRLEGSTPLQSLPPEELKQQMKERRENKETKRGLSSSTGFKPPPAGEAGVGRAARLLPWAQAPSQHHPRCPVVLRESSEEPGA